MADFVVEIAVGVEAEDAKLEYKMGYQMPIRSQAQQSLIAHSSHRIIRMMQYDAEILIRLLM